MHRHRIGLLVPFLALAATLGSPTARAEETADACVRFKLNELDKGIEYTANNSCERKLSCNMSWRVDCKTDKGTLQTSHKRSANFALKSEGENKILASAQVCGQSWRIEDVRWSCK